MGSRACSTEPMPSTKPTRTGVYGDKYKGDEEEASTISWGGGSYDTSKNFSGHGHSGRLDAGDNQFRDGPCNGNSGEAHAGGGISSRNGGLVLPGATGTFSISKTTTSSGTSATTGYPQHFNHGQKSHNQHQLHQPVNHNQLPHRQLHNYTHSQHHQYYSRHPQQANSHQHQPLSVHRQYPRPHDHQHGHRQQHHSSQQQTRQGYQQQLHRPHATNHQQGFLLNPTNKRFQPYIHPRHNSYMRQQQHHLHPNHSHYKHHQPIQHYHNQQLDMPRNSTHGRSQQLHYHSTHHNQQQHLRHSHHQQHQQPIHHNHSQQHHVHESRHTDECGPLGGSPIETPSPEHYHQVHQRHNDNPFNNDKYHFHFLRNQKTYNHFVHQLQLVHDAQQQYQQQYQPLSTEQLMEKHTNAQYTAIIGQFIHNPKQKGAQRLQQKRHLDNDNDLGRANKRHHHE
ncbi:hypothetical protein BG015_001699 [Linnemannia schmuckeri]|uniref:Uncharacterized protein n=1 Tax=Linnemannia schmuckeri TaxID=64567 RepID=A0A9P5RPY0_9FUNG|nr:hypothetical protein BG015_001699 [Linnemannia schmuckeri]